MTAIKPVTVGSWVQHLQSVKILIVEDHDAFRRFIRLLLQQKEEFQSIDEASDGLQAVSRAQELQPSLILLDIGLPNLNGFEACRRIRDVSPNSKVLFLSQESSPDMVQEALDLGALGYVLKARAQSDLLPAIDTVLGGKRFVSSGLEFRKDQHTQVSHHHDILFYSGDEVLIDCLARFVAAAINAGKAAIVLVTPAHRVSLRQRLYAEGVDIDGAIQQGTCVILDVHDALSMFMVDDFPDPVRVSTIAGDVIRRATKGTMGEPLQVVACGECAPTLLAQGKVEAAIQLERVWNEIVRSNHADTLCVYPLRQGQGEDPALRRICAEHTAVLSA